MCVSVCVCVCVCQSKTNAACFLHLPHIRHVTWASQLQQFISEAICNLPNYFPLYLLMNVISILYYSKAPAVWRSSVWVNHVSAVCLLMGKHSVSLNLLPAETHIKEWRGCLCFLHCVYGSMFLSACRDQMKESFNPIPFWNIMKCVSCENDKDTSAYYLFLYLWINMNNAYDWKRQNCHHFFIPPKRSRNSKENGVFLQVGLFWLNT